MPATPPVAAESESRRNTGSGSTMASSSRSSCSVPAPWRATDTEPQSGQAPGTRSRWPQWWQATSPAARCSTSDTSHCGHSQTRPQTPQERKFDQPRRFSSTIALPFVRLTSSSAWRVRSCSAPFTPSMPTSSTGGSRCPSTRSGSTMRSWRCMLSGRGVALPSTSSAPSRWARRSATTRAS